MTEVEVVVRRGWELVRLMTDTISVDIVPGLGGTIISVRRRADNAEILWQTPWGLRQKGSAVLPGNAEAVMLDYFPGGWQTLFPNAGETSVVHGVEWGFDGEARLTPFDCDIIDSVVTLTARLVRSPCEVTKRVRLDDSTVSVTETVGNAGGQPIETMWGQQVILGSPLLSERTVVDTGAAIVRPDPKTAGGVSYDDLLPWPRGHGANSVINLRNLVGPEAQETRLAYLSDFSSPTARVVNAAADLGVDLSWDAEHWPYLWYSLEASRRTNFPWFTHGYFLALTPASSWPAHGLHEARRVSSTTQWLPAGEERTATLSATVHPPTRRA